MTRWRSRSPVRRGVGVLCVGGSLSVVGCGGSSGSPPGSMPEQPMTDSSSEGVPGLDPPGPDGDSGGSGTSEGGVIPVGIDGSSDDVCAIAESVPVTVPWREVGGQAADWYSTPEALTLAENVVYYQNGDGGWPKNIDMTERTASRGGQSTIDNDATTAQIDILARVYSASSCPRYGDAARAGIDYLLDSQYDNGGWPQRNNSDGYAAHITYNDNAMVHVLELLRQVAGRVDHFALVDEDRAAQAAVAVEGGIDCILATQIVLDGRKTGWCAQHDEVTLEPARARTYELPSLSGSEGAALFRFLMTIDEPSPEIREAINAAAAWFEEAKLTGIRVDRIVDETQPSGQDTVVVDDVAAPPLWARFYELGTNRPIFSSRCEVPECDDDPLFMRRYTLAEIDNERRVGYAWYGNWPRRLLDSEYPVWQSRWEP